MTALPMVRQGTCQPERCGSACCRSISLEINPAYRDNSDVSNWISLHGIVMYEQAGRTFARIPAPCSALDARGWCLLYHQPERPALCAAFPSAPESLAGVADVCTFSFKARALH